ncbi:MAG: hypothetical protein IPH53_01845 [Flavobacteriales bacterium]|nr:hypothetical protein [Flavobacteriales bacterium]
MPTIKSLQLHVPSLAEQRSIADRLEKGLEQANGLAKCNEEGAAAIEALPGKLLGRCSEAGSLPTCLV